MEKLVIAWLTILLVGGCVDAPEPWKPDGTTDTISDSRSRNMDGKGEIGVVDVKLPDAAPDVKVVEVIDVVDATVPVEVKDLLQEVTDATPDVLEDIDTADVCQPECTNKECGNDGCGGSCGECGAETVCDAGQCELGILACGDVACPPLTGYEVACNPEEHCEYANEVSSGWKKWDTWIWIPKGVFPMGSPEDEPGHQDAEWPLHNVIFEQGFFISKYEVVVEQYEACMVSNPAKCTSPSTADWDGEGWGTNRSENGRSSHPQNGLTWQQAKDFCAWVAPGGRLPSEAEWEYAAKGPAHREYPWGSDPAPTCDNDTAVFNESGDADGYGCHQGGTFKVGTKTSGASWSGTLDMSGNLWEWCEDTWHADYQGAPEDGTPWVDDGIHRVIRGGSFDEVATHLRTAWRPYHTPTHHFANNGGRCMRPLQAEVCMPDCNGKDCGVDGCGGDCGDCGQEEACAVGKCIADPVHIWSYAFGGAGTDWLDDIAITPDGSLVLAGRTNSPVLNFGGSSVFGDGYEDIYVTKLSPSGESVWAKRFVGESYDSAGGIAVDSAGHIWLAGWFKSPSIEVEGQIFLNSSPGESDVLIVRFSPSGEITWSTVVGGPGNENLATLDIGPDDSVYVGFNSTGAGLDLGGGMLPSVSPEKSDIYVMKLSNTGDHLWSSSFGGDNSDLVQSVSVDKDGSMILAGRFRSSDLSFGDSSLSNGGGDDVFIAKLAADGQPMWGIDFGGTTSDIAESVATGPTGNVWVTGRSDSASVNYGGDELPGGQDYVMFVAAYDGEGKHIWSQVYGDDADTVGQSIVVDSSGVVTVGGRFAGQLIDLGGGIHTNSSDITDILLLRLDSLGNYLWSETFGGEKYDQATGAEADLDGNLYVGGQFTSPVISFGGDDFELQSTSGAYDIWVAKLGQK